MKSNLTPHRHEAANGIRGDCAGSERTEERASVWSALASSSAFRTTVPVLRKAALKRDALQTLRESRRALWLALCLALIGGLGGLATATAAEVVWREDFESLQAPDDWYSGFVIWEIGAPTYGPPTNSFGARAFEGVNCLATILGGDYPDDRESRIVGPRLVVPEAEQNPRLRFWHWWQFNCYDWGRVEISTDNGASWKALSGGFSADSFGRWSRAWFDLTPYAGQTVRLGFLFHSQSGWDCDSSWAAEVAPGWYVDDLVVEVGPRPGSALPGQPEDFEAGWGGWQVSYIASLCTDFGIWEIGTPASGPGGAHGGTNCATTVLGGDYPDNRTARLESPVFEVPAPSELPRLRFWHWWQFNCYDWGQVEISTDDGANWKALSGGFSADSFGRWSRAWFDLTPYAGQTVRLGFLFHSQSGWDCDSSWAAEVAPGWYVDDLVVEVGPRPESALPGQPEDFEAGWGGWQVSYIASLCTDFGIWEIGTPASGPGGAHAGTNCAATVLGGDYPDNRTARLESPRFEVPAAAELPRLRFWHWWRFNCYDWGQVEVSTDDGASWKALSGGFSADSFGRWSRAWFDLTPYAGQTVRLGFLFHSQSGWDCDSSWAAEVAPGWYVDDLVVEVGELPAATLPESFEGDSAGWWMSYIGGGATDYGIWEVGTPTSGPGVAHGGTDCAATILSGNYPENRSARLLGGPFQVPAADQYPSLRFWHWWSFNCYDWGQVQISTDNGANWTALSDRFTRDSLGKWAQPKFDLTPYAGQTIWLGFYFQSQSGWDCDSSWAEEVAPGWYVDQITIDVESLQRVGNRTVAESSLLTFPAKSALTNAVFGLGPGAPEGARIDPALGIFTWPTAECDGPSTNFITITVTDPDNPTLQPLDYETITVVVLEVNEAPVIGAVPRLGLTAGEPAVFNATQYVFDPDCPAQVLTYSLDQGSPADATIAPASGVLDWVPTPEQATQNHILYLRVTDELGASATREVAAGPVIPGPRIVRIAQDGGCALLWLDDVRAGSEWVLESTSELRNPPSATEWSPVGSPFVWESNPVRLCQPLVIDGPQPEAFFLRLRSR